MKKITYEIEKRIISRIEIIAHDEAQALRRLHEKIMSGTLSGEERFSPPRKIKEEELY